MDLTIGSLNLCIGSLGSLCLSDPIYLGPSASKTVAATTLKTSVGSSSEANSSVNIKPTESKRNIIYELDKIMENLVFKESSDQSDVGISEENSHSVSNYSEEDFTARYGDVCYSSEDEWRSGQEIYHDEPTIFSSDANHSICNQH
jgi:hypothetical protein